MLLPDVFVSWGLTVRAVLNRFGATTFIDTRINGISTPSVSRHVSGHPRYSLCRGLVLMPLAF